MLVKVAGHIINVTEMVYAQETTNFAGGPYTWVHFRRQNVGLEISLQEFTDAVNEAYAEEVSHMNAPVLVHEPLDKQDSLA